MNIKGHNLEGTTFSKENVKLEFSEPEKSNSKSIKVDNLGLLVSSCVMPGCDPRNEVFKECQDSCDFFTDKNSFLAVLFDGHGNRGRTIASFCVKKAKEYYFSKSKG